LMEMVSELTEQGSARNQLRDSLRNLDGELNGLSGRVDNMAVQHRHQDDLGDQAKLDMLRDLLAAQQRGGSQTRRSVSLSRQEMARQSEARAEPYDEDEEELDVVKSCRKPKHAIVFPAHTRVTTRPKRAIQKEDLLSDVHARVLKKAGEIGSLTSEGRRINSRARFVNVFKPRPDTCDHDLIVEPTKQELNIDFMAKSLAKRGACTRRFEVDDEFDKPVSSKETNARKDYCELRARKPIIQQPSNSYRVRYATMRARSRTALFGY